MPPGLQFAQILGFWKPRQNPQAVPSRGLW